MLKSTIVTLIKRNLKMNSLLHILTSTASDAQLEC